MPCMPAGARVKKATLGPASYETKTQQASNAQMPHTTLVAGDDAPAVPTCAGISKDLSSTCTQRHVELIASCPQ